jgi:hypothetical protein
MTRVVSAYGKAERIRQVGAGKANASEPQLHRPLPDREREIKSLLRSISSAAAFLVYQICFWPAVEGAGRMTR